MFPFTSKKVKKVNCQLKRIQLRVEIKCQQTPPESTYTSNNKNQPKKAKKNSMSRPGFEPGPPTYRASALPIALPRRITPGLISVVTNTFWSRGLC